MDDRKLDLDALMAGARRRAAEAPGRFAERVARLVHEAPEGRLERLMRSPARRPILEGVFWQMPQRLDARRADGVNAAVLWRIGGRPDGRTDDFRLVIAQGAARTTRGASEDPPRTVLTMTLDGVDFLKLITGDLDPVRGYLTGKIVLGGDIMFAAKLGSMFRIPQARAA
jgi:putative sterol carrier protein